eukprot:COSAG02_NODE_2128_length_9740_cov_20.436833_11_plen_550_part_01
MPAAATASPQSPAEALQADNRTLRAAIGSAPRPFWWPQPEEDAQDAAAGAARPSTAASSHHEAFAAAELNPTAMMRQRPEYVHWLYAQAQGYQGFVVPHSGIGSVALTTPHPLRDTHANQIVAQSLESMEDGLFEALLKKLQFRKLRSPSPVVEQEVPMTAQERLALRKAQALEAAVGDKPGKKGKKGKDGKKAVSWKVGPVSAPPARSPTPGPGETFSQWRELNTLQELLDEGQLSQAEHDERVKKVKKKHAAKKEETQKTNSPKKGKTPSPLVDNLEPAPEVAPDEVATDAESEPEAEGEPEEDPEPTIEELEALAAAEAEADAEVAKANTEQAEGAEAEVAAEVIEYVPEYDLEAASDDVVGHGPALDLLPYECSFKPAEFAEFSFDLRAMLSGYQGEALFCVLREVTLSTDPHAEESTAWAPLSSEEGISLSEGGVATVEIKRFGRIMVVWMRGLEQTQSLVDFLAAGLLAGLESSGKEADAEFRASFHLRCVAAVSIERAWNGQLHITQMAELNDQIEQDVSSGVFAVAEQKEREIAEAAEALRL